MLNGAIHGCAGHAVAIPEAFIRCRLAPVQVVKAAGWMARAQLNGYLAGAARRSYRRLRSLLAPGLGEGRCG